MRIKKNSSWFNITRVRGAYILCIKPFSRWTIVERAHVDTHDAKYFVTSQPLLNFFFFFFHLAVFFTLFSFLFYILFVAFTLLIYLYGWPHPTGFRWINFQWNAVANDIPRDKNTWTKQQQFLILYTNVWFTLKFLCVCVCARTYAFTVIYARRSFSLFLFYHFTLSTSIYDHGLLVLKYRKI